MVGTVVLLTIASLQAPDTTTYANPETAALIEMARQRHDYQDRLVRDYQALVRTRIDAGFGRSRFARVLPIVAHETAARVAWSLPNDLKVDVVGQRGVSAFRNADIDAAFDRPWFIPRSLGDSIRLVDDDLPTTAALHPLTAGAERFYHYAISDSVTLSVPGRTVNAVAVRIEPKVIGPALVAGDLWVDRETAEVVRFLFVFVGEYLWDSPDENATPEDSADTRRGNVWANRIVKLEADLEYALFEARYWMPYRQLVQLTVEIPWFVNVAIPVRFVTTFEDYDVNTGELPVFQAPEAVESEVREAADSAEVQLGDADVDRRSRRRNNLRCPDGTTNCDRAESGYFRAGPAEQSGRWEVHYPPKDSMAAYPWPDDLTLGLTADDERRIHETIGELGRLQEDLPDQWVGRMRAGIAFERFTDLYRFNRVQGSSVGMGFQFAPGPPFTTVLGTGRFGLGDRRPLASVTWRRDAPDGRFELMAYREVREVEPWTGGLGFGNSMNALFTAHDDADYYLGLGGGVRYRSYGGGFWRDAAAALFLERHRSLTAFRQSDLAGLFGSGVFGPNPAVAEGSYARLALSRRSLAGTAEFRQGIDVLLGLGSEGAAARGWVATAIPFAVINRTGRISGLAGYAVGDNFPQFNYRIGGPKTVRGYPYNARWGRALWAAQFDLALRDRADWSPVVFVDAGDAYESEAPGPYPSLANGNGPLVSTGVGLSLLNGLIRANLAKGLNPSTDIRFDLFFAAPR